MCTFLQLLRWNVVGSYVSFHLCIFNPAANPLSVVSILLCLFFPLLRSQIPQVKRKQANTRCSLSILRYRYFRLFEGRDEFEIRTRLITREFVTCKWVFEHHVSPRSTRSSIRLKFVLSSLGFALASTGVYCSYSSDDRQRAEIWTNVNERDQFSEQFLFSVRTHTSSKCLVIIMSPVDCQLTLFITLYAIGIITEWPAACLSCNTPKRYS